MPRAAVKKIKPLLFDSSGSSIVRFFGGMADVTVHWASGSTAKQHDLICPHDLGGPVCLGCALGTDSVRRLAVVWDVKWRCWSFLMADPEAFPRISAKLAAAGVGPAEIAEGKGCDAILQWVAGRLECEASTGTLGVGRGDGAPPSVKADLLPQLRRQALWGRKTPEQVLKEWPPRTPSISVTSPRAPLS